MPLPLTDPATRFEELLPDLPPETGQMARACKAFVRAKKVQPPAQRLRVVFLCCGLGKPLREVAGTLTALYESMTDQAVAERLRACGPWMQAMLPMVAREPLPTGRRLVVLDASSMQAPGAPGTAHRLPIAIDWGAWQLLEGLGRAVHPGATRTHGTLTPGAGVLADRGYAQCQGRWAAVQPGAARIVGLPPFRGGRGDAAGAPVALRPTLQGQTTATRRPLVGPRRAAGGPREGRGWVPAYRLHTEHAHRARPPCRPGHNKGTPRGVPLVGRRGVGLEHAGACRALSPDDHGVVVCALALSHIPDLGPVMQEFARVVRPGGRIVLSDVHPFLVLLGWRAQFSTASGAAGAIGLHVHLAADYYQAFAAAGLRLCRACRGIELVTV